MVVQENLLQSRKRILESTLTLRLMAAMAEKLPSKKIPSTTPDQPYMQPRIRPPNIN